jgi:hypothetical protein
MNFMYTSFIKENLPLKKLLICDPIFCGATLDQRDQKKTLNDAYTKEMFLEEYNHVKYKGIFLSWKKCDAYIVSLQNNYTALLRVLNRVCRFFVEMNDTSVF